MPIVDDSDVNVAIAGDTICSHVFNLLSREVTFLRMSCFWSFDHGEGLDTGTKFSVCIDGVWFHIRGESVNLFWLHSGEGLVFDSLCEMIADYYSDVDDRWKHVPRGTEP